LFLKYSITH